MPILAEPKPYEPFVVNTSIEDEQDDPAIAFLASGDYVVLWADYSDVFDNSIGVELKGQLFTRLGEPIGGEFAVNSTVPDHQDAISVIGLAGGGFVATWESPTSGTSQIYAQVFDSSAQKVGLEFQVNTDPAGNKFSPDVTALPSGGFVISWFQGVLKAQLFDAGGDRIGDIFNVEGRGHASRPVNTTLTSGEFVVAWEEALRDVDGTSKAIVAQRFSAAGAKLGPQLLVNTVVAEDQEINGVAALDTGGFVVVWTDLGSRDVKAQLFDAAGAKVGGEMLVNTTTLRTQWHADVSALPGYGFVVTWYDDAGGNGDLDDIRGQVFANDGTKLGGDFLVNAPVAGLQGYSAVAGDRNGNFVVVWPDSQGGEDASHFEILARPYTISGELDRDTQQGGPGDDRYIVDYHADVVIELPGEGTDIIYSSVSYSLNDGSEVESLSTITWELTDPINLTGNSLANHLFGNDGANQLDGKAGADVMIGRAGNDKYFVDNAGDKTFESGGGGTDLIYASVSFVLTDAQEVESLSTVTWESTNALNLTGNGLANQLFGNAGANRLDGRGGNDVLHGKGGADIFAFTTVLGANNVDVVHGFSAVDDLIALENNGVFVGLSGGALPASAFVIGTAAQDASDRIVYDQPTGRLFFDADGNGAGAQVQFALLNGAPIISASDFTVI